MTSNVLVLGKKASEGALRLWFGRPGCVLKGQRSETFFTPDRTNEDMSRGAPYFDGTRLLRKQY